MTLILGGPGGSGRSTLAKLISEKYNLTLAYGGNRNVAVEVGFGYMDTETNQPILSEAELLEFHEQYIPNHPEIDLKLDALRLEQAHEGNVVIESMTLAPITKRLQLPYTRIWIFASLDERVRRITKREHEKGNPEVTEQETRQTLEDRTQANAKRYQAIYGFDYLDADQYYEIHLDTTNTTEDTILEAFEKKMAEHEIELSV